MTKQRSKSPPRKNDDDGDPTEQAIAELVVLWPRLEAALARDSGGPSDDQVRVTGGGSATSAAVVDIDTQRAMIRIEQRVQQIAGEARPLLGITRPRATIDEHAHLIAQLEDDRQRAIGEVATVHAQMGHTPGGSIDRTRRMSPAQHRRADEAAVTIIAADAQIRRHRQHIATAAHRGSTLGVLEQLRSWYPSLRDRRQPLAEHIETDVEGWLGAARSALGLRTAVRPIDRLCPHHRIDRPTELVREADEAQLSRAVLAGREAHAKTPPIRWAKGGHIVRCPHCRERWVGAQQVRMLMHLVAAADIADLERTGAPLPIRRPSAEPILLPAPEIAIAIGRSDGTVRTWGSSGLLTRRTVIDPATRRARTLYDLDEAIGVSARAKRRERGLIAVSQVGTAVPTRRS